MSPIKDAATPSASLLVSHRTSPLEGFHNMEAKQKTYKSKENQDPI
jgi:hypothetical protein